MLNRKKFLFEIDFGSQLHCDSIRSDKMRSMLCDNVEAALQFLFYADEHEKKGNTNKMQTNSLIANRLIQTIEKATGKSWEDVHKIAKECMG